MPISIHKAIHDLTEEFSAKAVSEMRGEYKAKNVSDIPRNELQKIINEMEKQMKEAARTWTLNGLPLCGMRCMVKEPAG